MKKKTLYICPSVLSADFARLGEEVRRAEEAGADRLHLDIMDGHFVPNISFGPKVVAAINRSTSLFLEVHLMIYNPFQYIEPFVEAGADLISFHFEATEDVEETLEYIRRCHIQTGLAINPETPVSFLPKYFPLMDEVLLMSVHPGFGGQPFIEESLSRIAELATYLKSFPEHAVDIAVDGGINNITGPECVKAGANLLVSGNYLYSAPDMGKAMLELRK